MNKDSTPFLVFLLIAGLSMVMLGSITDNLKEINKAMNNINNKLVIKTNTPIIITNIPEYIIVPQ